jgi:chromosome segregation protein
MECADALYGVSMRGDGISQVISQRLRDEPRKPPRRMLPAQQAVVTEAAPEAVVTEATFEAVVTEATFEAVVTEATADATPAE